ncbi:MAG: M56 family metallopeptidase [Tannerellaceae bacterium]|jgi:TonB family protein|nr:M56 family metallopeptidase [Tannerellaceae bacterium]
MSPEATYYLKVNIAIALFYGLYCLFFRRDTFFHLRRVLLMAFFVIAVAYPFLNLQEWIREHRIMLGTIQTYAALMPETVITPESGADNAGQTFAAITAQVCYMAGAALLLARFIIQLIHILWMRVKSEHHLIRGIRTYGIDGNSGPFSFFRMIFLSPGRHDAQEVEEILEHECTHVAGWHSVDIMISELMCIVFWFNPFVWLLSREIRSNLEYIADSRVLAAGFDSRVYQYHLLGLAYSPAKTVVNVYNNFNVSHLKNRIIMMNKKRSGAIARTKYLIILPLAAMLMLLANVGAVARITHLPGAGEVIPAPVPQTPQDKERKVFTLADEMPQFPGGEAKLIEFLLTSVKYPQEAQESGKEGRVTCAFVVESDGSITETEVMRSIDPLLDAEALRVINLFPKWTPGKIKGKAVAVRFVVPVTFHLAPATGR